MGFSYAVINKLFIGVRLGIAFEHWGDPDASIFSLAVLPYLEYVFLNGVVRPFVSGTFGLETWIQGEGGDYHTIGALIAGGGGAHFYIGQNLSIDLTGLLGVYMGGGELDGEPSSSDNFFDVAFRLAILFGLSGWF